MVRHPVVAAIVNAYEAFEKKEEEAKKEALEAKKLEREQHSLKALENLI